MAVMDRRSFTALVGATAAAATVLPVSASSAAPAGSPARGRGRGRRSLPTPYVVGHRGASGYRPEHTLASYTLAAHMGADFIEPDLVITKDGVLVCRHEPEISGTTDVSERPDFAARRTTKTLDGVATTGWFVEDFTLAELRTLRAVERLPKVRQENTIYDGLWQVPTFEEVLKLRKQLSLDLGREIGVYPETKHPTYFREIGLPLEERLVPLVQRYGLNNKNAPIRIQSFELTNLLMMRSTMKVKAPLVFLTSGSGTPYADDRTYAELLSPAGLRTYADQIDGLGPDWSQVIARNSDGTLGAETDLVKNAHAVGLEVCPYTVRAENQFLPTDYRLGADPNDYGRVMDLLHRLYDAGIDGIFSDNPDVAVVARDTWRG